MTTPVDIGTLIERDPSSKGGRERLAGTSVTVSRIAILSQEGLTADQIATDVFEGRLPLSLIHAALAHYHANREAIEAEISNDEMDRDRAWAESKAKRRSA